MTRLWQTIKTPDTKLLSSPKKAIGKPKIIVKNKKPHEPELMMNKLYLSVLLFTIISRSDVSAQLLQADTTKPEIGKAMPDFFLSTVTYYKSKTASGKDFRGQWLFLDFWFTGCTACVRSLPKVNEIQKAFKDKLNWVMVGINNYSYDKNSLAIQHLYEKLKARQNLEMISAYDSILYKRWEVTSMPHIYIIDPNGILRSITSGRDITKEKIQRLLNGEKVSFHPKTVIRPRFLESAVLENDNILFRSILAKWNGEKQQGGSGIQRYVNLSPKEWEKGFQFAMVSLYWLYNTAYLGKYYFKDQYDTLYGKVYPLPVLEVFDKTLFDYDLTMGKGLYNYNLRLPKHQVNKQNIMRFMQQDLERTFNFRASVEKRKMPVWLLVVTKGKELELTTKGATTYNSEKDGNTAAGFQVTNLPVKEFLRTLTYYLASSESDPFVDGTNIISNIDITIDAVLADLEDVRKALNKHGLDLIKGYREMTVLVIKDP